MSDFTAHNIRLDDGTLTCPEIGWLVADSPWFLSAKKIIELVFPDGASGKSIIDLGCLEGGYAVEFARMGMDAAGIEVRQSNFANCERVRAGLSLPNLSFYRDDVWNVSRYGGFDVTFCCGLLYHLENPRKFIDLISGLTRRLLLINTHISTQEEPSEPRLGPLTEHEGLAGRWYSEYAPGSLSAEELEAAKWTSWENSRSFWPTREALLQTIYSAGFNIVFEQMDWLAPDFIKGTQTPFYQNGRRMLVGIR